MRILIVSSYLPYPLFSGGHVRLYNLMKELASKHEITLICEKRSNQTEQDIAEVKKVCKKVITVERRKQWSLGNIAKAATSFHSFLLSGHTNKAMRKKIREALVKDSFDVIHVETYYVMQNVPEMTIPVVLVEHNIEYKVYEKFALKAPAVLRPLLTIDIAKIKREEETFWRHVDALVAVSKGDKKVMEDRHVHATVVSNGVNTKKFSFKAKGANDEKRVLFIGDFKWIQNTDTVKFIIENIWPLIKKQENNFKLWFVGRSIPNSLKSLANDPDVLFDEASSNLPTEKIFQKASVLLAPIRVGGGTSYKILESMSCGTPVVTMQMSADALDAVDGHDIMVGETADELAKKTLSLLQDQSLYEKISKNGRVLIEKKYTWKEIGKNLEEVYQSVTS